MSDADDDQSEYSKIEGSALDLLSDMGHKLDTPYETVIISSGNRKQSISGSFSGSENSYVTKLHLVGNIGKTNIQGVVNIDDNATIIKTKPYPMIIHSKYQDQFTKQYGDIIGAHLKKKIQPGKNQREFKRLGTKKTIVLAIDGSMLKTSIFAEELPRVDGTFIYQKLKIHVCFRKFFREMISQLKEKFELIAWQSSQKDYAQHIVAMVESQFDMKFSHSLSIEDQNVSEDFTFYLKNLDILLKEREISSIIIIDSVMSNFTNRLTNGIYLPTFSLHNDDDILRDLTSYLLSFENLTDVRPKIKTDFDLLNLFDNFK